MAMATIFVNENNGSWDHHKWIELCDKVTKEGYAPIDFDQMGLMLEKLKAELASVAMKLSTQKELGAASMAIDVHKHHVAPAISPVLAPPSEPPGRAPDGQAFAR